MVFEMIGTTATAVTEVDRVDPVLAAATAELTAPVERTVPADPDLDQPSTAGRPGGRPCGERDGVPVARSGGDHLTLTSLPTSRIPQGPQAAPSCPPAPRQSPSTPTVPTPAARALPRGVVAQLLRSAVALQAEGVLRTAGALAGDWGSVLDRREWIERDARDLSLLAAAAVAADVPLPAGVDTGAADPDHPRSVVESLLVGHEALVRVLRQLADVAGVAEGAHFWRDTVRSILSRREEEMALLRSVGACGDLPADERYKRGRPPRV